MPRASALTPAVQAAFVAALRGGALVEAAARDAGVAISSLYWRRHRDPVFAAAWNAAVALSAAAPGRRLRFAGARRARFLARFAASCNILMACAETGIHPATVYRQIGGDRRFERGCRAALARGTARLERKLAAEREAARRRWARHEIVPTGVMTQDFDEQMKLLARWERPDGSLGRRFVRRGWLKSGSFDEAIAALDRRLRAMEPRWGGARNDANTPRRPR